MYDTCISKTNFFSSMSWQELKVISRDTTGLKNGMCLGVVVEEVDKIVGPQQKTGHCEVGICSACVSLW